MQWTKLFFNTSDKLLKQKKDVVDVKNIECYSGPVKNKFVFMLNAKDWDSGLYYDCEI